MNKLELIETLEIMSTGSNYSPKEKEAIKITMELIKKEVEFKDLSKIRYVNSETGEVKEVNATRAGYNALKDVFYYEIDKGYINKSNLSNVIIEGNTFFSEKLMLAIRNKLIN